MDGNTFDKRLRELIRETASLTEEQKEKLSPLVEEARQRQKKIKDDTDKITESFTNLRICIKYLLFDLEATRRERDELKDMLDDQQPPDTIDGRT